MVITAAKLEAWHKLDQKRLELQRQARQHEQERDALSVEFKGALEELEKTEAVRGKFRVRLADGRPSVSWKDEFIKGLGAEAAAAIVAAAPIPQKIEVETIK